MNFAPLFEHNSIQWKDNVAPNLPSSSLSFSNTFTGKVGNRMVTFSFEGNECKVSHNGETIIIKEDDVERERINHHLSPEGNNHQS